MATSKTLRESLGQGSGGQREGLICSYTENDAVGKDVFQATVCFY